MTTSDLILMHVINRGHIHMELLWLFFKYFIFLKLNKMIFYHITIEFLCIVIRKMYQNIIIETSLRKVFFKCDDLSSISNL